MKNIIVINLILFLSRFLEQKDATYKYKYKGPDQVNPYVSEVEYSIEYLLRLIRKGKTEVLFGHGALRVMRITLKK